MDELEALSIPIQEYLKAHHHPHASVVITDSRVMVVEITMSIPTESPDPAVAMDLIQPG
jgi:hypothetical protein